MFDTVISVENVGKRYTLSHRGDGARYATLREEIAHYVAAPFRAIGQKMGGRNGGNSLQDYGTNRGSDSD
jgi:hypothetical protein